MEKWDRAAVLGAQTVVHHESFSADVVGYAHPASLGKPRARGPERASRRLDRSTRVSQSARYLSCFPKRSSRSLGASRSPSSVNATDFASYRIGYVALLVQAAQRVPVEPPIQVRSPLCSPGYSSASNARPIFPLSSSMCTSPLT